MYICYPCLSPIYTSTDFLKKNNTQLFQTLNHTTVTASHLILMVTRICCILFWCKSINTAIRRLPTVARGFQQVRLLKSFRRRQFITHYFRCKLKALWLNLIINMKNKLAVIKTSYSLQALKYICFTFQPNYFSLPFKSSVSYNNRFTCNICPKGVTSSVFFLLLYLSTYQ